MADACAEGAAEHGEVLRCERAVARRPAAPADAGPARDAAELQKEVRLARRTDEMATAIQQASTELVHQVQVSQDVQSERMKAEDL